MRKQKINSKAGITLIALIITVIILLILAGIAISGSINSTDLFGKSKEASDEWNKSVDIEENSITGVTTILDMTTNPDLAKYKLTVTVNEDETVDSPYYVNYPSAKGTIKCRVMYNDNEHGLQIIAVNPITKIRIGKNDPNENVEGEMGSNERAINSYNRAIITLNEAAESYMETADGSTLAIDARCPGTDSKNKNYPCNLVGEERQQEMFVADSQYSYMNEYNGKFFRKFAGNPSAVEDGKRLWKIGARSFSDTSISSSYWWGQYTTYNYTGYGHYFSVPVFKSDGILSAWGFITVNEDGNVQTSSSNVGFRPILILSPDVKIIGGEGTEEVPFELGL